MDNAQRTANPGVRPILFSAPMVRALIAGTKTQTRRLVKSDKCYPCPYGLPGDLLWVRETWRPFFKDGCIYLADAGTHRLNASSEAEAKRMWPGWKPSIHMPRRFSRITLEITGARVERLQEISQQDCLAEGIPANTGPWLHHIVADYRRLWGEINGADSWESNPRVWVLTFEVIKQNVDQAMGTAA